MKGKNCSMSDCYALELKSFRKDDFCYILYKY